MNDTYEYCQPNHNIAPTDESLCQFYDSNYFLRATVTLLHDQESHHILLSSISTSSMILFLPSSVHLYIQYF